jgi:catechol 2,3-dioxygenase-like lactoylglutathione lyase family enzyme
MSIAVVSVPVKDQDAAKAFYIEKLQFELLVDTPMGPEMRWVQLQPKSGGSSISLVTWFEQLQPGGQQGIVLHVPDVDAEHARLAALGIEMREPEDQPWGRFTMFQDPDGNGWIYATLTEPENFVGK